MTKTEQLDALFENWKQHFKQSSFYRDGIIHEAEWNENKPGKKLLVIAKEANTTNHTNDLINGDPCFRDEWNKESPSYTFARRIVQWDYGFINDFPPFDKAKDQVSYLRKIAFMNLNKGGGGREANDSEILKLVLAQKDFLKRQLYIIEPDVIIICNSFNTQINEVLFPNAVWKSSGYDIYIAEWQGKLLIDFYHPSSRNVGSALYCLLAKILEPCNHCAPNQ